MVHIEGQLRSQPETANKAVFIGSGQQFVPCVNVLLKEYNAMLVQVVLQKFLQGSDIVSFLPDFLLALWTKRLRGESAVIQCLNGVHENASPAFRSDLRRFAKPQVSGTDGELLGQEFQGLELIVQSRQLPTKDLLVVLLFLLQI